MDAKCIVPFVRSVENVFTTMLQMEVNVQAPRLIDARGDNYDVSGIIGMGGDVTGAVILSMPVGTAERVVEALTGERLEATNPDFADAVGEMVNMIAGGAKAKLPGNKLINISCPSVVVGKGHQVARGRETVVIGIPCDCAFGPFQIEVMFQNSTQSAAAVA